MLTEVSKLRSTELALPAGELALPAGDPNRPAGSWAELAVKGLLSCYPKTNAMNPGLFYQMAAWALEDYPIWVIAALCCPKSGIVTQKQWTPQIAELVAFCDSVVRGRQQAIILAAQAEDNALRRQQEKAQAQENKRRNELIDAAMKRLRDAMYNWPGPLPGMGSYRARDAWEKAMIREMPPETLADIVDRLNANPRLME